MRERPDTGEESAKGSTRKLELSLPQVAGSAIAAVIAAKLASSFGVYGTILGAGVVSVIATCGGSVFQHFFHRTGEQIREVGATGAPLSARRTPAPVPSRQAAGPGGFTEGTVYRARVRGWKRPLIAAALVFGVTMAGITTYELVSGSSFSGTGATTVGDAVTGGGSSSTSDPTPGTPGTPAAPDPTTSPADRGGHGSTDASPAPDTGADTGAGTGGSTPTPSPSTSDGGTGPSPSATPSAPATSPEPSASSRSGTDGQDPAGPATP